MFTILAVILCLALGVVMTLGLAGAMYENRAALPYVGTLFIAILIFGTIYGQ